MIDILTVDQRKRFFIEDDMIFQEDNAPAHRAKMEMISIREMTSQVWNGLEIALTKVKWKILVLI